MECKCHRYAYANSFSKYFFNIIVDYRNRHDTGINNYQHGHLQSTSSYVESFGKFNNFILPLFQCISMETTPTLANAYEHSLLV
jgi:hypothetical protein